MGQSNSALLELARWAENTIREMRARDCPDCEGELDNGGRWYATHYCPDHAPVPEPKEEPVNRLPYVAPPVAFEMMERGLYRMDTGEPIREVDKPLPPVPFEALSWRPGDYPSLCDRLRWHFNRDYRQMIESLMSIYEESRDDAMLRLKRAERFYRQPRAEAYLSLITNQLST